MQQHNRCNGCEIALCESEMVTPSYIFDIYKKQGEACRPPYNNYISTQARKWELLEKYMKHAPAAPPRALFVGRYIGYGRRFEAPGCSTPYMNIEFKKCQENSKKIRDFGISNQGAPFYAHYVKNRQRNLEPTGIFFVQPLLILQKKRKKSSFSRRTNPFFPRSPRAVCARAESTCACVAMAWLPSGAAGGPALRGARASPALSSGVAAAVMLYKRALPPSSPLHSARPSAAAQRSAP
ncbi:hypothetical protein CFC21_091242 [Triticum aestivum]|uniref:Uncharacterized protein n=2 Tax=Triticum aestivum TaxID=4565 RepID=A0A9R1LFW2_WHEAT|nr:hypothetical protein CFC21_091242 [Triticum aestivum]